MGKKIKNKKKIQKKKIKQVLLIALAILFIFNVNLISSEIVYLNATKDSYVREDASNTNYGTSTSLEFRNSPAKARRIYAEFPLNISSNYSVINSSVCFYLNTDGSTINGSLYYVYNVSFMENVITWNNQPCGINFDSSINCSLTSLSVKNTTPASNWICWNIPKSITQNYLMKNLSLVLKSDEFIEVNLDSFNSRETITIPYININTCLSNWIPYNTTCSLNNSKTLYYLDSNNCGTNITLPSDNGTIYYDSCDYCQPVFECSIFEDVCEGSPPTNRICNQANDTSICCDTTGLFSDCIYTGNLSLFDEYYHFDNLSADVSSYPYINVNESYEIALISPTHVDSSITIYITNSSGQTNPFNFSFISGRYRIYLLFDSEGDYPFVINGTNPCFDFEGSLSGTFKVRTAYYITIKAYEMKTKTTASLYKNDFAYLIAEYPRGFIDTTYERFVTPLNYGNPFGYQPNVFYASYNDGEAVIKLYERDKKYLLRLVDGQILFDNTYSPINVTKSYGTNIYLGEFYFDGTNHTYSVYLDDSDINQYRFLVNWAFVIMLGLVALVSVTLFFMIPQFPAGFYFGIGLSAMLVIIRVVIWFFKGY
jgi:hypothetical protein